ncbi:MAG: endo alpha-1,4 polygalactosaminidase [Rhizobiaceae bacterium]|nr:endo alpha-1,4 polygalactosaminidase [Rhizobiaceae bacterium]
MKYQICPLLTALVLSVVCLGDSWAKDRCLAPEKYDIDRWSIQLQQMEPDAIVQSDDDLIIIDYSKDGSQKQALERETVLRMKKRADGRDRLVLAYLSIGEAEDYRYYWRDIWNLASPSWIGEENRRWPGNYHVRFWEEDWQGIIYAEPGAYLDRILDAGFDGAFLDIVDAFEYWSQSNKDARMEMINLVERVAQHARTRNPEFLIIAQNGERLLQNERFRNSVDAVVKEDLFYGVAHDGERNSEKSIETALANLASAKDYDIPVLAIEYLPPGEQRDEVTRRLSQHGILASFGDRLLREISQSVPAPANAATVLGGVRFCRS